MSNKKQSISIIIPVYNSKRYIVSCINSILNQLGSFDFQIILVDDGSDDGSYDFMVSKYSTITFVEIYRINHQGQSAARNLGISKANRQLISFIDSDDLIPPDYFLNLTQYFDIEDVDIVCCSLLRFKSEKELEFKRTSDINAYLIFNKNEALEELPFNNRITFSPTNKIYSKKLFKDIFFKEDTIFEDLDISYKLINNCLKVVYTTSSSYYYRIHSNSTMTSLFTLKRIDEFERKKDMFNFYYKLKLSNSTTLLTKILYVYSGISVFVKMNSKVNYKNIYYLLNFDRSFLSDILFKSQKFSINFLIFSLYINKKIIIFYKQIYRFFV
jgi:glycosyltransferase involved in cell wall biosynthesis